MPHKLYSWFTDVLSGGPTRKTPLARAEKNRPKTQYESLETRQLLAADLISFPIDAGVLYQIHGHNESQGQLSEIDVVNSSLTQIGDNAGFKINGVGFRTVDGLIYGMKMNTDELMRIGADGNNEVLGAVDQLPEGSYYTGDFGADGLLYVRHLDKFYGINVDELKVDRVVTANESVTRTYDIAFNPQTGLHYTVRKVAGGAEFISIDLREGEGTGDVTVINGNFDPAGTYGAIFSDANGRVFAANNQGGLYEIDYLTGVPTYAGDTPRASSNDGAFSSAASIDLPPVSVDGWMSTIAGSSDARVPIVEPYDLEDQPLTIVLGNLPDEGVLRGGDGNALSKGQTLTVDELLELTFDASEVGPEQTGLLNFDYSVSDGSHTVNTTMEISLAGYSKISGSVVVLDDTEDSAYAGYAYNNEIKLSGTDDWGGSVEMTTLSDINGNFSFEEVPPGVYSIVQDQPPIVFDNSVVKGNLIGDLAENSIVNVSVPQSPQAFTGLTFNEEAPVSISGFMYEDSDGNGVVGSAEPGIASVKVALNGIDSTGEVVQLETTSDSYGFYEFFDLRAGNYTLTQTQPDGCINGVENAGDFGGAVSNSAVSGIELSQGQQAQNYNFGELRKSTLTGSVFIDNDIDNAFDLGDTPLSGVTLHLTGTNYLGEEVSYTTVTNEDGSYLFDDFVAGVYTLEQEQPSGLEDGKSHVGIFDNDDAVYPENGRSVSSNRIGNVEVGIGRNGRSYNFSETVSYQLANRFDNEYVFVGTENEDKFSFEAGETYHVVTVNGVEHRIDATSGTARILFNAKQGFDTITLTGSDAVEQATRTQGYSSMRSQNWFVGVANSEQYQFNSGGGFDRAFIYDTPLDDRVKMTQDYTRLWNDESNSLSTGFHRTYVYAVNGGEDRAYLYDSKYDDTVKMKDNNARVIGRKFYNFSGGFERVYAYSINGGSDRVQFWDSSSDMDTFEAKPSASRMFNDHFYNYAEGFYQVDSFAILGGENDRAFLHGSANDDILIANPSKAGMVGEGFNFDAHRFERLYSYSNGGNDRAYLFDSKLNDRFLEQSDNARLYNNDYFLKAVDFAQVDAYSSKGGDDRAYFYDSEGDDILIALENEVRMYGEGFDNTSHGFARTYGHSNNGGSDVAVLYDSDRADTVKVSSDFARMYGERYYTWLGGFEDVTTKFVSTSRYDRALVFGAIGDDTLTQAGEHAQVFYDQGSYFVYNVDAHSEDGNDQQDDDAYISILDDLMEVLVEKV
jgi:hypothetical protein